MQLFSKYRVHNKCVTDGRTDGRTDGHCKKKKKNFTLFTLPSTVAGEANADKTLSIVHTRSTIKAEAW